MLRPGNRARLKANGTVIYLHADPAILWERVRHSRNRPLLQTTDPRNRLATLYEERDALYRDVADHVVDSDRDEVLRFAHSFAPNDSAHEDTR